jgi:hypothetical protein
MLKAELDEHLGYENHCNEGNSTGNSRIPEDIKKVYLRLSDKLN